MNVGTLLRMAPNATMRKGCFAWYPLCQASGAPRDHSGKGTPVTLGSSPVWTATGLWFDGSNDVAKMTIDGGDLPSGNWSCGFEMYPDGDGEEWEFPFCWAGDDMLQVWIQNTGGNSIYEAGSRWRWWAGDTVSIPSGSRCVLFFTYDGSTLRVYVNGELLDSGGWIDYGRGSLASFGCGYHDNLSSLNCPARGEFRNVVFVARCYSADEVRWWSHFGGM
jgi:hypothetical protein